MLNHTDINSIELNSKKASTGDPSGESLTLSDVNILLVP